MEEIKKALEGLASTFEQFKKANDERIKQIETKGHADPLLEEKVGKLNKSLDDIQGRIDKAETIIRRTAKGGDDDATADTKEAKEYKTAFDFYLRKGNDTNLKTLEQKMLEQKALSVGSDPEGGYLVRPEVSSDVIKNITETTPMRQIASVQIIGGAALEQMRQTSDTASGGWVSESGARNETAAPKVGMITIMAHEQYAEPRATQTFLDDAAVNVEQWLAGELADIFAITENTAFVSGDGVGKPRGILAYAAGTGDGQIEQVNSGTAGAVTADGLISLQGALKESYQVNASWLMHRSTVMSIRKLKDTTNQYIWQPGLMAGTPDLLLGRPIVKGGDMPVPAANSLSIAYGDFRRGYKIVDRLGISVLRDPFTTKPFVKFYTTKRTGGGVINFEALKIQKLAV